MAATFNPIKIDKDTSEQEIADAIEKVHKWCEDNIRTIIDIYFKRSNSIYSYLTREYPILVDDEMPTAYMVSLAKADSPAMFTGDYVAISTLLTAKSILEGAKIRARKRPPITVIEAPNLPIEISTIIAHEYTHALYNHTVLRNRFNKRTGGKDDKTYMFACEIQANRGVYVDRNAFVYELGVTEEKFIKDVPDIATAKTLDNIYIAIKNVYKDKINQQGGEKNENQGNGNRQKQQPGNQSEEDKQNQGSGQEQQQPTDGGNSEENEEGKELNSVQQEALNRLFKQEEKKDTATGFLHDYSEDEVEHDNEKDAKTLLREYNERVETAKIKKSLLKLRAVLKGDLSKGKVPTYSRPSRRQSDGDLFKKGKKNDARFNPSILLALDSSGSMSSTTVKQVTEATVDIIKALGRDISNCYICLHESKVFNLEKLKDYKKAINGYNPNGGNDFLKVYEKAIELNCDVVLNVGDGIDSIQDSAYYCGKDIKNDKNNKKDITWYDCLIYKLDDSATEYYHTAVYMDEKLSGVKRKTLDLVGSLRPKEDFKKEIEEHYTDTVRRRS